jgi:hypothetical protein
MIKDRITDHINPTHYKSHPSGVECIQIAEHFSFCLGNAMKYIWRADLKNDRTHDIRKAIWYLERELGIGAKDKRPSTIPSKEASSARNYR